MTREIKFRGMDVSGNWHIGNLTISHKDRPDGVKAGSYISGNSGTTPWAYEVRPETVGQFITINEESGVDTYEDDVIEITQEVRTGTRKVSKSRGYSTYAIKELKLIRTVVKMGTFGNSALTAYYETNQKESYDSYFYCAGRKSDTPKRESHSLDSILIHSVMYKVVGNIHENPELLEA